MELPRGNKRVATFCRLKNVLHKPAIETRRAEGREGKGDTGAQTERQRTNRNMPPEQRRKSTFVHTIHHTNDTDVQVIQHRLCQEGRGLSLLVVTVNTFDLRQGAQEGILIDGTVSWRRKCVDCGD